MPQSERPDEVEARNRMSARLGVELVHADTHGGVDYRFTLLDGRSGAAEVTTVTDPVLKGSNAARATMQSEDGRAPGLEACWSVTVSERETRYTGLRSRLLPLLSALEKGGVKHFELHRHVGARVGPEALDEHFSRLASSGVVDAQIVACPPDQGGDHFIFVSSMGAWTATGSDDALERIEGELAGKADNAQKLADADVDVAILWVWLDADTPGEIARPFRGGSVEDLAHFGVPTRPPKLDAHISELWIVHRGLNRGWRWTRDVGWQSVSFPSPLGDSLES